MTEDHVVKQPVNVYWKDGKIVAIGPTIRVIVNISTEELMKVRGGGKGDATIEVSFPPPSAQPET